MFPIDTKVFDDCEAFFTSISKKLESFDHQRTSNLMDQTPFGKVVDESL